MGAMMDANVISIGFCLCASSAVSHNLHCSKSDKMKDAACVLGIKAAGWSVWVWQKLPNSLQVMVCAWFWSLRARMIRLFWQDLVWDGLLAWPLLFLHRICFAMKHAE